MTKPAIFSAMAILFSFLNAVFAAPPFDSLSLQGYLKTTGGTPVNGTFNGRVTLYQNAAPCWNSGPTLVPIVFSNGAFAKTLSGGVAGGACVGALCSAHFTVTPPFTWTLALDIDGDGAPETSFSNIPITSVPLAMVAERLTGSVPTSQLSGTLSGSSVVGGTFGAVDGSALINLSAVNLTGLVPLARLGSGTPSAATYLRGDSSWQTLPTAGEVNTASNVGAGSGLYKQKTGANLELRSLTTASSKLVLTQNTNDIAIDIDPTAIGLASLTGNLAGDRISGGTLGATSAANLTNIPAANLTGSLPALNGSALTNLSAGSLTTGTVASALLPQASMSSDGLVSTGTQTFGGAKTFSGAVTMASTFSNSGAIAWAKTDVATSVTVNCLSASTSIVRLTGIVATTINGINPGIDGQILLVYTDGNIGTALTIAHNNAGACTNGKIFTNTAANILSTTAASTAAFIFVYNLASLRWHMVSAAQ